MAGSLREDVKQYMARSERTLEAAQVLAEHGYWADVLSKTYFAMFYAASALPCEEAEQGLRSAREFVEAIRAYLESEGEG